MLTNPCIRSGCRRSTTGNARRRPAAGRTSPPRRGSGRNRPSPDRSAASRTGRRPAGSTLADRARSTPRRHVVVGEPVDVRVGQQEPGPEQLPGRRAVDRVESADRTAAGTPAPARRPATARCAVTAARLPPALSPPSAIAVGSAPSSAGVVAGEPERGDGIVDGGRERVLRRQPVPDRQHPDAGVHRQVRHTASWLSRLPVTHPPPWWKTSSGDPGGKSVRGVEPGRQCRVPICWSAGRGDGDGLSLTPVTGGPPASADADLQVLPPALRRRRRGAGVGQPFQPQQQLQVGIEGLAVQPDRPTGQRPPDAAGEHPEHHPDRELQPDRGTDQLHRRSIDPGVPSGSPDWRVSDRRATPRRDIGW